MDGYALNADMVKNICFFVCLLIIKNKKFAK